MFAKFLSFALIGIIGTFAHYSVLYTLVELQDSNPVWASGWGALTGLIVNYALNFKLTFNSRQPHIKTFPKFALIGSIGMGFNIAIMELLVSKLYYLYAQIMTTLIVLIWNFIANSFWTFETDRNTPLFSDLFSMIRVRLSGFGLILMILTISVATLGFYPLYGPSESRYAEMARKMLEKLKLSSNEDISNTLDGSDRNSYVLTRKEVETLSDAIKTQLQPIRSDGKFILFHAVSGDLR